MTLRDNRLGRSNSERSASEADLPAERATPQPTVLSTVWEGPAGEGRDRDHDAGPQVPEPDTNAGRSSPHRWLIAPASGRRVVIITVLAALVSGVVLSIDDGDEPSPVAQDSVESIRDSLGSQAVAAGEPADTASGGDRTGAGDPIVREAVSADERLRLSAESLPTATGSWMLEARPIGESPQPPTVRFTVNGAIVEEVDRAPYRLLLNPELLASLPSVLGEGQPLIVTASVMWPEDREAASPATLVLPD